MSGPRAVNMRRAYWIVGGRKATFAAERPGFGIETTPGRYLTRDGVQPSVWTKKKTAEYIAEHASAMLRGTPEHWTTMECHHE